LLRPGAAREQPGASTAQPGVTVSTGAEGDTDKAFGKCLGLVAGGKNINAAQRGQPQPKWVLPARVGRAELSAVKHQLAAQKKDCQKNTVLQLCFAESAEKEAPITAATYDFASASEAACLNRASVILCALCVDMLRLLENPMGQTVTAFW